MNPFLGIALIAGVIIALSLGRTVKAAKTLDYRVNKFRIYNFVSGGDLVLHLSIRFINPTNTALRINFIDLGIFFNPTMQSDNIISRGIQMCQYSDTTGFSIAANNTTDKDFYLSIPWTKIALFFGENIINQLTDNNAAQNFRQRLMATKILVLGTIKAENINIPIQKVISLES